MESAVNSSNPPKSATKPDDDDMSWPEMLGLGILLVIRWPFTPFWKEREFDYDSPNPLPKSKHPYAILCTFGIIAEVAIPFMFFGLYFGLLYGPKWPVWVAVGAFAILTGIRIYMYGRNESEGWSW